MVLRFMRRLVGKVVKLLRAKDVPEESNVPEKGASYYDALYAESDVYRCTYSRSFYYFLWSVITDRIRRDNLQRVFEVGCGPGQMAAFLMDQGIPDYTGFDISSTAIEFAQRKIPLGRFFVGSALDANLYSASDFDVLICTEVLEHIESDLRVVSLFPSGRRCICTVPNFPYESHVRHFRDADDVRMRYGPFFLSLDVMTLPSPRADEDRFFLFDGVRNEHTFKE